MKFKIERSETTHAFRETQITEMRIRYDKVRLSFQIEGRMPQKMRRSICLAIYRQIKPILKLRHAAIYHLDSSKNTHLRESIRLSGLEQALDVRTSRQKQGMEIRLARLSRAWTLKDFARETGISATHLSRIEHGSSPMRKSTLRKIETALQVRLSNQLSEIQTLNTKNQEVNQ